MKPSIIGRRLFTDGIERNVYLSDDGRQYVQDEWGMPIYGVWLLTDPTETDVGDAVASAQSVRF